MTKNPTQNLNKKTKHSKMCAYFMWYTVVVLKWQRSFPDSISHNEAETMADDICKGIFLLENILKLIQISLKFVPIVQWTIIHH